MKCVMCGKQIPDTRGNRAITCSVECGKERRKEWKREWRANPEYWEREKEQRRNRMADPEYKERVRERQRERQRSLRADPEYREWWREQQRKRMADPEYQERMRKLRADPEYKERKNEQRRNRFKNDPEFKAREKARIIKRRRLTQSADAEAVLREEVFERDGWVCQLCGEPVDPDLEYPHRASATLDHIIPLSKGGSHTYDNTQLAHSSCNSSKCNRELDEEWMSPLTA